MTSGSPVYDAATPKVPLSFHTPYDVAVPSSHTHSTVELWNAKEDGELLGYAPVPDTAVDGWLGAVDITPGVPSI